MNKSKSSGTKKGNVVLKKLRRKLDFLTQESSKTKWHEESLNSMVNEIERDVHFLESRTDFTCIKYVEDGYVEDWARK